ncbi:MAG: hypothetical protein NC400_11515 [Clostridium sp.]|nr:hypothetical protein [Clostridium sp.]
MFLIQIIALLTFILAIAWKFQIRFVESIPIGCSLLVFELYFFCFLRRLSFSDVTAAAWLVIVCIYVVRLSKEKRAALLKFSRQELLAPGTLTALAMMAAVTACVSGKLVSWWDDYNFWATDVKSLFYLDGFAEKYANVAAEFGDYPPGTQMMKWWFLHFSPGEFREGLMFAGYYFFNLAFLFPLLKVIKKRNVFAMTLGAVLLWLFPAVAEVFWLDGCCADLTMALVYGAFLASVADQRENRFLYYGRQALYLAMLILCKNTGFIWAAFGLIFDYGYHFLKHRKISAGRKEKRADRRALLIVTLFPILAEGSWLGFCLINRRVAKLTGTAIKMAVGNMNLPAYQGEMVKAFAEAFVKWPLHRGKTPGIDLSPLGLYFLLILAVFLLGKFCILEKKQAVFSGVFLAVSGAVFYAINLVSHLTIFAVETQYLEPFGMVSSIERYGAPFAIGGMYLLAFYVLQSPKSQKGILVCALFVLLTADCGGAFRGLFGYRSSTEEILAERADIVDEAAGNFLEAVGAGNRESIGRVLYLRDISDVSWVRNTYTGFEAAPVSVMYGNLDAAQAGSGDIVKAVQEAHAGFLYVDELSGDGQKLFEPFAEEPFEYGRLYRITEEAGEVRLIKYSG